MTTLAPVDFKAVAAQGCFVYCYLRSNGTPYYVGMSKLAKRPFEKHNTGIPCDRSRIRVLRSGLSWEEAARWERFYIAKFGRKDLGTGILRNLTDGGDGVVGHGPEALMKIKLAHIDAVAASEIGVDLKEYASLSMAERRRIKRRFFELGMKGVDLFDPSRVVSDEGVKRQQVAFAASKGKRYGFTGQEWSDLTTTEKNRVYANWRRGERDKRKLVSALCNGDPIKRNAISQTKRLAAAKALGLDEVLTSFFVSLDSSIDRLRLARRFRAGKRGAELLAGFAA